MKTLCPQRIMAVSERQEASVDFHDLDHRTRRHLCRPSRSVRLGMDSVVRRHDPSNPRISTVISGILSSQRLRVIGTGYDTRGSGAPFPYYDPTLMKIFGLGSLLALLAICASFAGIWRKNALRWHALASGVGMLAFWIVAMSGE